MNQKLLIIASAFLLLNCGQPSGETPGGLKTNEILRDKNLKHLFTQEHAVRIMGEPVVLDDSSSQNTGEISSYACSYSALAMDLVSGKTRTVYVMIQQFSKSKEAAMSYAVIKKDNENHEGVETLQGLGDEAYFHSDHQNFYFILVRKGEKVFRMKVNKISKLTSLDAFHSVAREITSAM